MKNSKILLPPPPTRLIAPTSAKISRKTIWLLIVLSFLGFLDAAYLTANHYLGVPVPCSIEGCETVLTSDYATTIFNLPIALFGAVYYFIIFLLALNYLNSYRRHLLVKIVLLTGAGVLASLYFVYLQLYVIEAICLYCLGSATITTLLFITSLTYRYKKHGV